MTQRINNLIKLDEVYSWLNSVDLSKVKLFFAEYNKKENPYLVYKTKLGDESNHQIQEQLVEIAKDVLIRNVVRYTERGELVKYYLYTPTTKIDRLHVEYIPLEDIPNFETIYAELNRVDLQFFSLANAKKIIGYIVKIPVSIEGTFEGELLFIKKYTVKGLLKRGRLNMIIHGNEGRFSLFTENIVAIDKRFDVVLLNGNHIYNGKERGYKVGYIFNKSQFESFFRFIETYTQEIDTKKKDLLKTEIIDSDNLDQLVQYCEGDLRKIRKLAKALKDEHYKKLDYQKMIDIKEKYKLEDLTFTEDGKIVVTSQNIWTVLKLLSDDYLTSEITSNKYESHSKIKRS